MSLQNMDIPRTADKVKLVKFLECHKNSAMLRHQGAGNVTDATCLQKRQWKDVFSLLWWTGRLFAVR